MYESDNTISYELQQLSGWLYDGRGGYSLGYLLRKLPLEYGLHCIGHNVNAWVFTVDQKRIEVRADTPENALCQLAIKLFKVGVLKRGEA